jgi:hypothetical protein
MLLLENIKFLSVHYEDEGFIFRLKLLVFLIFIDARIQYAYPAENVVLPPILVNLELNSIVSFTTKVNDIFSLLDIELFI